MVTVVHFPLTFVNIYNTVQMEHGYVVIQFGIANLHTITCKAIAVKEVSFPAATLKRSCSVRTCVLTSSIIVLTFIH